VCVCVREREISIHCNAIFIFNCYLYIILLSLPVFIQKFSFSCLLDVKRKRFFITALYECEFPTLGLI